MYACSYDNCTQDSDCASGKACVCGVSLGTSRTANQCLASACVQDSDCGEGGYCSPSAPNEGCTLPGDVGYFCHTGTNVCKTNGCVNDGDCTTPPAGGPYGNGFCAWNPSDTAWECVYPGAC